MAPSPLRLHLPRPQGLSLGTYNIRDGWIFGLARAIWEVHLGRFGVMWLTETNITIKLYFHNHLVYDVVCYPEFTTPTGGTQRGAGLFFLERPQGWSVVPTRFHGPNMVSCEVISSSKRTPLVGAYLPPYTLEHLPNLYEALSHLQYQEPIVIWYLKDEIGKVQKPCSQKVAGLLMYFRLVDLLQHFRQCLRFRHLKT